VKPGFLALLGAFCLPFAAQAASSDCAKAKSELEQVICDAPEFFALEEELARAYHNALDKMEDAEDLRIKQRFWLNSIQSVPHNWKKGFRDRIEYLNTMPVFPMSSDPVDGPTFQLTDRSKHHDFTLRLFSPCQKNPCMGMGQIFIYRKN
jgi:uncharacterized protein